LQRLKLLVLPEPPLSRQLYLFPSTGLQQNLLES
jgi:hypothetical protein